MSARQKSASLRMPQSDRRRHAFQRQMSRRLINRPSVVCELLHFGIGANENNETLFAPLARTLGKLTYDIHGNRLVFLVRAISAYNADTAEFLIVFHDTTSHKYLPIGARLYTGSADYAVCPRHCYYTTTASEFLSTLALFEPFGLYSLPSRNSTDSTDSRAAFFRLSSK